MNPFVCSMISIMNHWILKNRNRISTRIYHQNIIEVETRLFMPIERELLEEQGGKRITMNYSSVVYLMIYGFESPTRWHRLLISSHLECDETSDLHRKLTPGSFTYSLVTSIVEARFAIKESWLISDQISQDWLNSMFYVSRHNFDGEK